MNPKYKLSPEQKIELIKILKTRFEKNPKRHDNIKWEDVQKKLESNPETVVSQRNGKNRRRARCCGLR